MMGVCLLKAALDGEIKFHSTRPCAPKAPSISRVLGRRELVRSAHLYITEVKLPEQELHNALPYEGLSSGAWVLLSEVA
jgi:hypothetical protein